MCVFLYAFNCNTSRWLQSIVAHYECMSYTLEKLAKSFLKPPCYVTNSSDSFTNRAWVLNLQKNLMNIYCDFFSTDKLRKNGGKIIETNWWKHLMNSLIVFCLSSLDAHFTNLILWTKVKPFTHCDFLRVDGAYCSWI